MKEKFIDWNPSAQSLERIGQIGRVLIQYRDMGIRLTLRQLYYQLVSKNIIENKVREYKRLGSLLSNARLAGLVDWEIIEDRARRPVRPLEFDSIQDRIALAVDNFRLRRWSDQPEYIELWCEKDALSSVLAPICDDLHVTLMVNRGYSSSSAMYEASKRIGEEMADRAARIIYLGDFDPSGEDMVRDVRDRMATFGLNVDVSKLALNPDQISKYKLPPNPAKRTDSRSGGFIEKHGEESFEVDAIPPDVLQSLVRSSLEENMDRTAYRAMIAQEDRLKKKLIAATKNIE